MLSVLTWSHASAQSITAIFQLAEQVNVVVTSARNIYETVRFMVGAVGGEPPPPIPADDPAAERRAAERHQELSQKMDRLNRQMLALEQRLIATEDALYDIDQMQLYRSAFAAANSSFDLVEDYYRTPLDQRPAMDAEVLQQLIRVVDQASGQTVAPSDRLGVHYVAALNITSLALVNLRSIYASNPDALSPRFRNRLASGIDYLDRTTEMAMAENGMLANVARREVNAYRARLAELVRHRHVSQLVAGTRFREGLAQACYQFEITRDCRGEECGDVFERARRIGGPTPQVTTGFRQFRYAFQLERETVGSPTPTEHFNMMKGLRPAETAEVTTSRRREEGCQSSGDPERAWLRATHTYNEVLLQAAPTGERASTALGGLALARATRDNLADLRTRL